MSVVVHTPLGAAQHGAGGVARGQVALAGRVQVQPEHGGAPHREHAQPQLREHRRAALRHVRHLRATFTLIFFNFFFYYYY